MTIVATDTSDQRALVTSSLMRTQGGVTNDQSGTLVHVGAGLYLTAGHVLYQYVNPDTVRSAQDYRLTVRDGLDTPYTLTIGNAQFGDAFHNLGWGTSGGADISAVFTGDTEASGSGLLIYADPDDASGALTTFGYPNVDGYDGSTMIQVAGTLVAGSHRDISTSNGPMSVLTSAIGMQVVSGQSGSGMWLTADPDGDGHAKDYLAGIVTLDLQYAGGLHATGFEPAGDIYAALGALIESHNLSPRAIPRATLVAGQSAGSAATDITGTVLWEDLLGGMNADTLDGGGGKDRLYGRLGDDVLIDGADVDNLYGDGGADTFQMVLDGATDVIRDFENGVDVIDISAWAIRSIDELTVETRSVGTVLIRGGQEKLYVEDAAGTLISGDIDATDFVFAADTINVIVGTSAGEKLFGTIHQDELHDLGGIDALFGRAGPDRFVLSADGAVDSIKDYEDATDTIDLGQWSGASFDALAFRNLNNGKVLVSFGDEDLVVMNQARTLTTDDLDVTDFVFL